MFLAVWERLQKVAENFQLWSSFAYCGPDGCSYIWYNFLFIYLPASRLSGIDIQFVTEKFKVIPPQLQDPSQCQECPFSPYLTKIALSNIYWTKHIHIKNQDAS